jgi:hypothetical protein
VSQYYTIVGRTIPLPLLVYWERIFDCCVYGANVLSCHYDIIKPYSIEMPRRTLGNVGCKARHNLCLNFCHFESESLQMRGRRVNSSSWRCEFDSTQVVSPKRLPRLRLQQTAGISVSLRGSFTRLTQLGSGQGLNTSHQALVGANQRYNDAHRQSWARSINNAHGVSLDMPNNG